MPLGRPLLDVLDAMGYGGLVVGKPAKILRMNRTAAKILLRHEGNCRDTDDFRTQRELVGLMYSAGLAGVTCDEDGWTTIKQTNADPGRPLILRTIPLRNGGSTGPHNVIILIDLHVTPRPTLEVLKRVFGLTRTEARLAIELTCGKTAEDVALNTGVTVGTVRKQLASVFSKTNTHRQSELVALLCRLTILP